MRTKARERTFGVVALLLLVTSTGWAKGSDRPVRITGTVTDATSGKPVECRLYIQGKKNQWYFPDSSESRDVVVYKRENYWDKSQVEMHATIAS